MFHYVIVVILDLLVMELDYRMTLDEFCLFPCYICLNLALLLIYIFLLAPAVLSQSSILFDEVLFLEFRPSIMKRLSFTQIPSLALFNSDKNTVHSSNSIVMNQNTSSSCCSHNIMLNYKIPRNHCRASLDARNVTPRY